MNHYFKSASVFRSSGSIFPAPTAFWNSKLNDYGTEFHPPPTHFGTRALPSRIPTGGKQGRSRWDLNTAALQATDCLPLDVVNAISAQESHSPTGNGADLGSLNTNGRHEWQPGRRSKG